MHKEIFSPNEREMLKLYLETDKTSNSFRVLKHRILQNYEKISQDFQLLKKAYEKITT
jgi:hypothetical protein